MGSFAQSSKHPRCSGQDLLNQWKSKMNFNSQILKNYCEILFNLTRIEDAEQGKKK